MTGQRWHIIGFHTNNGLSMAKQPQQKKAATTLHKRKSTRYPIARRILCFFSYSNVLPTRLIYMVQTSQHFLWHP